MLGSAPARAATRRQRHCPGSRARAQTHGIRRGRTAAHPYPRTRPPPPAQACAGTAYGATAARARARRRCSPLGQDDTRQCSRQNPNQRLHNRSGPPSFRPLLRRRSVPLTLPFAPVGILSEARVWQPRLSLSSKPWVPDKHLTAHSTVRTLAANPPCCVTHPRVA